MHSIAVNPFSSSGVWGRGAALALLALLLSPIGAYAGHVRLAWDPSPDPNVSGYMVYYGTTSGVYTASVNVGNTTTYTINSLANGVTLYFVVKAYSGAAFSNPTNQVSGVATNLPPSITNPGSINMRQGALTLQIVATDPDFDMLTYSATGLPSGLAINSTTGMISGTVPVGVHTITARASDGPSTVPATFVLTATVNNAPTLAAVATQNNDTNDVVSLQLVAADLDLDPLTFSSTGLPAGLTLNASTGRITGTPANGTGGANPVTVTVSDGALAASRSFTWNVTDLNPGLVAAYGFEEASGTNATDLSGNSNTGAISGASRITTGRFGKALSFDGVNDWVTVNDAASLDLTTAMTLEAWVYPTAFTGWETVILKETSDRLAYSLYANSDSSLPAGQISNDGVDELTVTGTAALPLNTWTHLATTYDGATVRLFVNGVQVGTLPATGSIVASTGPLRIGGNAPFGGWFQGRIDEVRIFRLARSAAQIAADMNSAVVSVGSPPTLTNPGTQTDAENDVVSLALAATDPDGDAITYSATGLPPSLTLNASTGVISGTLSYSSAGSYTVVATATAAGASDSKTFTWTVTNTNRPPVVTSPGNQTGTQGVAASLAMTATDPDANPLTFSAAGLPTGLTISASSGVISGTPTAPGVFNPTVTVSDGTTTASASFSWTIGGAPTLTNPGNRTNAENAVISLQLAATDPDGDVITYSATGLPPSLTVNAATGLISGTLSYTSAGSYTVVATATAGGASNPKTFTWTVTNTDRAPTLTNPGNRTNAENAVISLPLAATDPDGETITYSATGLPPSLTVNATTGLISGTLSYTSAGSHTVVVTATAGGVSDAKTFTWTITNTNRAPVITSPGNQSGTTGAPVSLSIAATDPDGDPLTFSAANLPTGLSINASSGVISGTPTTVSAFSTSITVSDGTTTASASFSWTIVPGAAALGAPSGTIATATPSFNWTAVSGATRYELWVNDAGQAAKIDVTYTAAGAGCSSDTSCAVSPGVTLATGAATWWIRTSNNAGDGTWSSAVTFTVAPADTTAPTVALTSPTSSTTYTATGGTLAVGGTASDNVGVTQVSWTTNRGGSGVATGTTAWTIAAVPIASGTTVITVTARDAANNTATDTLTVTYDTTAPTIAVTSPTSSATYTATSGTLAVGGTASDSFGVTQVSWTTDRGGSGVATGTTAWTIAAAPIAAGTTVITVTARDAANNTASDTLTVTYNAAVPPGAVTLIAPTGTISTATPSFSWTALSGATHYQLWVNDASVGAKINVTYPAAAVGCGAGTGTCTVSPGVTLAPGTATWWIVASNAAGNGPWGTGVTFTVPTTGSTPGAATLLAPSGAVATATPSFSWTAVSGATNYQLWVNDAITGAKINVTYPAAAVGCGAGTGTCTVSPGVTLAPGTATWWILTSNAAGNGSWSAAFTFTVPTASTPPGAATLLAPSGAVATATPSFSWAAVSGATNYQLWVNDASTGAKINITYTAAAAGCGAGTGTCTVSPGVTLAPGTATWWILTSNAAGPGPWSTSLAFIVP